MLKSLGLIGILLVFVVAGVVADDDKDLAEKLGAVKVIDWNKLATIIPDEVKGMEVSDIDGGTMSMVDPTNPQNQFNYSNVTRTYTSKDKKEITLTILDTGFSQFLMMPFMMQMEYDSPDGAVKSTEIAGFPAKLIYEKEKGKIEKIQVITLIGKRVLVTAEGDSDVSKDDIDGLFKHVDLKKLSELADVDDDKDHNEDDDKDSHDNDDDE